MALCKYIYQETPRPQISKFLSFLALIFAAFAVVGCASAAAPTLPVNTPSSAATDTPAPPNTTPATRMSATEQTPESGRTSRPDEPDPTSFPAAGPPPEPLPTVPASDLPKAAAESSLLQVMEKLPASFGEKGVWFADYAGSWEAAGLPPRPGNLEDYLALSDEEREAYQTAQRGLISGPKLWSIARQYAQGWEELFGFSSFAVSLAVSTGSSDTDPFGATYFEADFDPEDTRQRLLDLGYSEEVVSGGTYYAIPRNQINSPGSPIVQQAGLILQMTHVLPADGIVAASPNAAPIVDLAAAASGNTSTLSDDPALSRLAASLGQPLSAALLPRQVVLEAEGRPQLGYDAYPKPEDWGDIHQWEALGAGYVRVDGDPWWSVSLFYPDPMAAAADAGEIVDRMQGYESAIPLIDPTMSAEGLARLPEHPIDQSCASLTPVHTSDENGSVLTIWCQVAEEPAMSWWLFLELRDLGFLLP